MNRRPPPGRRREFPREEGPFDRLVRSRFERDPYPDSATRIQRRDIDILEAIHNYRFLTTSQVASLFFGTKKRAERRLRKLYDAELVDRIFRPVVTGTAEIIYVLNRTGISILSQQTGMDTEDIEVSQQRARKLKPLFLDHFIDINQFRVALTLGSEANSFDVLFWKYENEYRVIVRNRDYVRVRIKEITLGLAVDEHVHDLIIDLAGTIDPDLPVTSIIKDGLDTVWEPRRI